ncbi:phage holin family protein [Clostridium ganghwense]|uniref:Phage holin family protein n=1 Tax=Clostridium ganghwense TaxID=312089 RepID=A0ABT4CTU6_9CLOT|nr:phage holin family protein [Clostridium ganghwense]MCY6372474.1 phage holin family protein [Clostridium ganghwense]
MNEREIFNTVIVVIGSFFTYIFGIWDTCLIVLVAFMSLDYITGLIAAIIQDKLNSHIGFKGILRKSTILLVLIVAVLLDRLLSNGTWVFRTIVAYFYIGNEGISILENVGKCGVPLPKKMIKALEQLRKKEE